jgi:hypothetical protein
MSFLRRLFGGGSGEAGVPADAAASTTAGADDAERERELADEDRARLSESLLARQLRYADRKWTPPTQGGPRRADDGERSADSDE